MSPRAGAPPIQQTIYLDFFDLIEKMPVRLRPELLLSERERLLKRLERINTYLEGEIVSVE